MGVLRVFGDVRNFEPRPIIMIGGVFLNVLSKSSSALFASKMFSGRSCFRERLEQLCIWVDLLRLIAHESIFTFAFH